MPGRILIVEDDLALRRKLHRLLTREDYFVASVAGGREALAHLELDPAYDLVLLQDALPDLDGYTYCEQLRLAGFKSPIIILAREESAGRLAESLAAGADDYLISPIDEAELLARIHAHIRRMRAHQSSRFSSATIRIGPELVLDAGQRMASVRERPIQLSPREYSLLSLLAHHPNTALEKAWLLQQVWGSISAGDLKVLAVTIRRLRVKIEADPQKPKYIVAVRGYGYKLVDTSQSSAAARSYRDEIEEMREVIQALVLSGLAASDQKEKARAAARRLEELVHGLHAIVWEADAATWQFSFVDGRAAALLGFPADRWLTDPHFWETLVHPEERDQTLAQFQAAVLENRDFELEFRAITADGVEIWLLNMVYFTAVAEGQPKRLRGVMVDITERRKHRVALAVDSIRDHQIAETLQRSMLLKIPQNAFAGLELSTNYIPSWDEALVGGDFLDAFALEGGRVALVVGDVEGKGLAAAARTVEVKYGLRAFLQHGHTAAEALCCLNNFVYKSALLNDYADSFIVLAVAIIDAATGETEFVSAGAEPPMVLRAGGDTEEVYRPGLPLGVQPDSIYESTTVAVNAGDTVLLATDGIVEARNGRLFLGEEGLVRLAYDALRSQPYGEVAPTIVSGARAFAGGILRDDACLLLARRK